VVGGVHGLLDPAAERFAGDAEHLGGEVGRDPPTRVLQHAGGQVQHVRPVARGDLGGQRRLAAQRLIGRGGDGRVQLGHQVGGLVQEHPRDPADQVRGLR